MNFTFAKIAINAERGLKMSLADDIKDKVETAKKGKEKQLADRFNRSTYDLMEHFLDDVQLGKIQLGGINDFSQLFKMFQEVNNLSSDGEGGSNGAPPELSLKEEQSFENVLKVETKRSKNIDGDIEEQKEIKAEDIKNLSSSDVEKLAEQRTKDLNNRNGGFDVD